MAKANPPPHQILPESILKNKDLAQTFERFSFDMFLLWKKVGGGSDFIEEALQGLYEFDDLKKIDVEQSARKDVVVTNSDYTTINDQTIICSDINLTITLNSTPEDQEKVNINSPLGRTYINGNGRKMNGELEALIRRPYTTWDIIYILELDEWIII